MRSLMKEKEQLNCQQTFIEKNELAKQLSRSMESDCLSTLPKEEKIKGKGDALEEPFHIVCIGGANVDRKAKARLAIQLGTSNPVSVTQTAGGVARNIAENLGRLGQLVSLVTVVGDDQEGDWLLPVTSTYVDITQAAKLRDTRTGTYTAVLDEQGEMVIALADMEIYDHVTLDFLEKRWPRLASASAILLDTNFPVEMLAFVIERCREEDVPLCVTPVSAPKVNKLPRDLRGVTWLIANEDEALALAGRNERNVAAACTDILFFGVEHVIVTRGGQGVIYKTRGGDHGMIPSPNIHVTDVTGAGDAFVSGFLYGMNQGASFIKSCRLGMSASIITLQTEETVCSHLDESSLQQAYQQYFS